MLLLPFPPRRAWLRSFWGAFVLYWTMLVSFVLSWFCNSFSYGWATVVIAVLGLLGFCWPQLAVKAYTMWNGLMLYLEQVMQWAILSICYYVIIMAVGRTNSSLRLARPASTDSLWRPRDTLAQHAYAHPYIPHMPSSAHQSWLQTYFTWAKRSQNMWALCLLPLLLLLRVIGSKRSNQQLPANIYTLF
jgi:hypothetical protein